MANGFCAQWQRTIVALLICCCKDRQASRPPPHSIFVFPLLERFWIGFVLWCFFVEEADQFCGAGGRFYFASPYDVSRADFGSVELFVGAAIREIGRAHV